MVTGTTSVAQPSPVTAAANMTSSERPADSATPPRRPSDNRRSNKPIMEKRRRARINNCLNELKALILDAMKKDPARHSKLEKADILEMTVKHLENLQRQQVAMSAAADPSVVNKFRAGFSECAGEVGRFPGLEPAIKRRLLQHLATCLSGATPGNTPAQQQTSTNTATGTVPVQPRQEQTTQLQVHILPTAATTTATLDAHNGGIIFSNGTGTGVQLVPTRLPNGDIALVLPAAGQQAATLFRQQQPPSPPPMLVPIPTRTASTASASSATSSTSSVLSAPTIGAYSAPSSPEPDVRMVYSPPAQKPLSLVIRKTYEPVEEEKPWRPW